jgi:NAD(P)-dependent dehydrogenase (short-subunit alcohol dehydrogenase family)
MNTLAVVGAGPGLGLSIARRFGREGFRVGMIARRASVLDECVRLLGLDGIEAAAFTADAGDERQIAAALAAVEQRFDGIDVLEFSPMPFSEFRPFSAVATTTEDASHHFKVQTLGAIASARHVLPGMIEGRRGTLLFTTGLSAVTPLPALTPVGIAMSGVRNYARCLNQELASAGIYAGTVSIGVRIQPGTDGDPDRIAELYWDLHVKRDRADVCFPGFNQGTPRSVRATKGEE